MGFHTLFFEPFINFSFLFINKQYYFLPKYVMISSEVKIMREKLQRFMMGRYGMDSFSKFMMGAVLVMWILDFFLDTRVLYSWSILLIIYVYFRMFSRNISKHYQENQKFLEIKNKVLARFRSEKSQMKQRKTHHIYKCPTCRQKIRIPRGKGRICITCPKCKTEFTKTS